jgi:hypothetical protein
MPTHNRDSKQPVVDNRTLKKLNVPESNNLNSPRGAALVEPDSETHVIDDDPVSSEPLRSDFFPPLRMNLWDPHDFSRREIMIPFGGIYTNVARMINSRLEEESQNDKLTAGVGLVESNGVLAVDEQLTHVTRIGTLDNLVVDGDAAFTGAVVVPPPTDGTHAVNRDYADGLTIVTAGDGLTKTDNVISLDSGSITSVGTLTGLTVDGDAAFTGAVVVPPPTDGTHAVNRDYADGLTTVTAGDGLTKTDNVISLDSGSITSVGTLTGLTVDGDAAFTGAVVVPPPTDGTHAVNRDYADGLTVTAGDGLTKTDNVISLDSGSITSVGTLTGLTVDGAIVTPMEYYAPAEGDTITAPSRSPGVILNPSDPLNNLTIAFPSDPANGQRFSIHTTQNIDSLTATATFAPNNDPPLGLTAGIPLRYIYSSDIAGWVTL